MGAVAPRQPLRLVAGAQRHHGAVDLVGDPGGVDDVVGAAQQQRTALAAGGHRDGAVAAHDAILDAAAGSRLDSPCWKAASRGALATPSSTRQVAAPKSTS